MRIPTARVPMLRLHNGVLILAAAAVLAGCGGKGEVAETARPVLVTRPGDSQAGGRAYAGEVRAREESPLSFRVGGKLLERRVDVGAHVEAGQVLAVLDPGDLQAQNRAAQAQLAAAEAKLASVRADQARYATLADQQLVSRSALDAQNAALKAAQGEANAARANQQVASNQAEYSQLRAPRGGVIATRNAEAGQVVAAGQQVFGLAADGAREIAFAVPENLIDQVHVGQSVLVELWSQSGQRWPGTIRELSPAADQASRTFAARVSVNAPTDSLGLGQSARVLLPESAQARISIPVSAVQRNNGASAVFVVDPATSTLKLQPVQLGPYGEDSVPVISGLEANAWIVSAGGHLLRAGQKVAPVDRDNRPVKL